MPQRRRSYLLLLVLLFPLSFGSKILFIMSQGPRSHKMYFDGIADALARAHHQVTVISPYKSTIDNVKIEEIILPKNYVDVFFGDPFKFNQLEAFQRFYFNNGPVCIEVLEQVQEKLNEHYDFVILSMLTTDCFLPIIHLKLFMNVFKRLGENILWKFEGESLEDIPANIRISKWLPQNDILAQPNLRLFITQGGRLSILEATHHGVPILGIPVFADQKPNVEVAVHTGWGKMVEWKDLEEENLFNLIVEALNDTRMKSTSKMVSSLMRDQPISPKEAVVYWVEYVIRYGGANHLKSPFSSMSWIKMYNMDVWFVAAISVSSLLILLICSVFFTLRCLFRIFCSRAKKVDSSTNSKSKTDQKKKKTLKKD